MKVFISWSGERSKQVARALFEWIPCVIQAVKPWMSEQIAKGARWSPEITKELEETRFGIVCLTPENLSAQWLMFESGALAKSVERTYVCPYLLFGLKPTDIEGPLAQFQATVADRVDTLELMKSINAAQVTGALHTATIDAAFDVWWPKLENQLQSVVDQTFPTAPPRKREVLEVVEEILEIVRHLNRGQSSRTVEATTPLDTDVFWQAWNSPRMAVNEQRMKEVAEGIKWWLEQNKKKTD